MQLGQKNFAASVGCGAPNVNVADVADVAVPRCETPVLFQNWELLRLGH